MDSVENIRNIILQNKKPSYQTTNKMEVRVRCPYCGDSKSNPSSAHLYIQMRPPFKFHCFKCETSGVLNNQVLRDFGIYDSSIALDISNSNKEYNATKGIQKISSFKKINLTNKLFETDATTLATTYFNNRFNVNLDSEYIRGKFKAVLDSISFFNDNNLNVNTSYYDFSKSIGFISSDNSHIVFRDISGLQDKRYSNLSLSPQDEDFASKIYNIKSSIDILQDNIKLVITEGIFDIIGVYLHFYKDTPAEENTIFAAACGKSYNAVILNYIRQGFLNLDIEIYSDADVNIEFYRHLKNSSPYLKNMKLTVFYNTLYNKDTGFGKDYGVPKNQIKLGRIII